MKFSIRKSVFLNHALTCESESGIKMHSTENRCVIGPKAIQFAGVCVHFSARKSLQAGVVKGLK